MRTQLADRLDTHTHACPSEISSITLDKSASDVKQNLCPPAVSTGGTFVWLLRMLRPQEETHTHTPDFRARRG